MKATIFHKTFEFNVPQDVALKYLKACEILDKEEGVIKESKPDFDNMSDELFPLIALSALVKQTPSNIDNELENDDIHTITINCHPSMIFLQCWILKLRRTHLASNL